MTTLTRAEAIEALSSAQFRKLRLKPTGDGPAPHRLGVANRKGGAGKTTTAVNLAAAFALWGWKVRIVDADAQDGSATVFLKEGLQVDGTLLDVYQNKADLSEVTYPSSIPGVWLVPSSVTLTQINNQSPQVMDDALLTAFDEDEGWDGDLEVTDTAPNLGPAVITALVASHAVVIPLNLGLLDESGVAEMVEVLSTIKRRANPDLQVAAVVLSKDKPKTMLSQETKGRMGQTFPEALIWGIPDAIKIAEQAGYRASIFDVQAGGSASLAFWRLAAHLVDRLGYTWDVAPEDVAVKKAGAKS